MSQIPILRQCWKCKVVPSKTKEDKEGYYVFCFGCGKKGNRFPTRYQAIRDWNKKGW